ncbi:hypothetical protein, partial [Pseudomonas corrugata]|uniref:hypothetical protein n=1 Tax=Pseudomonas corrugata TaxID=47879 RepID=UPI0019D6F3D5
PARDAFESFVHHTNAPRTATARFIRALTDRVTSGKPASTKAKAPEYGALRNIVRFSVTSHLKLARPLQ